MAQGDGTSADVPGRYDVVINGKGYMLLQTLEPSIPFRTHRAIYTYTPTFLERQNVSGSYGDNSQDFFLTASQDDWSLGEDQRFFRAGDADSIRKYWRGSKVDVSVPGQVTIRPDTIAKTFATSVAGSGAVLGTSMFAASSTNLYEVAFDGTITDRGAHGAGGLPDSMCSDGIYLYLTGSAATSIRRYDTGAHTFTSFSATKANWIAFSNNTLYGTDAGSNGIAQYDTSGSPTNIFTWKNAIGGQLGNVKRFVPFGGKLAILTPSVQNARGAEVWVADNTGASRLAELPTAFSEKDITEMFGIIFVIGLENNGQSGYRTAVYYIANGNTGKLWSSATWGGSTNAGGLAICPYLGGLLFTDYVSQTLKFYDLATAAVSSVAAWTPTIWPAYINTGLTYGLATQQNNSAGTVFFSTTSVASSATVQSSLFDFDNSLTKILRSVKADFISATDGNGGSVDIAYQVDSLDGAYTSLKTGATSGTEYTLPANTTGRSISVQITLNKGTSTSGPILKRVYVRAAPQLQSYRNRTYILDLSGIGTRDNVKLADGMFHPLSGHEQADNLNTAIQATSISISDRFVNQQTSLNGTTTTDSFTGVCEPADCEIYDVAEGWDDAQYPGGYVAKITVREI